MELFEGLVEPEVVATSPCRIKSPVPVCCGFDSVKLVLTAGVAPALATFSTSLVAACKRLLDYASGMVFPAGFSPAASTFARSRSDKLSYGNVVLLAGLPPATSAFGRLHSGN